MLVGGTNNKQQVIQATLTDASVVINSPIASFGNFSGEEQGLLVGGHKAVNGIWKWDGLYKGFLTRNGWVQGQPSNRVDENCMAVSSSRLLWSDRVYSARFKYICEKFAA